MGFRARLRSTHGRTLAASVAAVTAATGAVAVVTSGPAMAVAAAADYGPGDGLHRYVVTPDDAFDASAGTAASAEGVVVPPSVERGRIDLGLLAAAQAELGAGGRTVQVDRVAYYVVGEAAAIVSPGGSGGALEPAQVPADLVPGAPASGATAALEAIAGHPAVDSAQLLDGGQVLVATRLDADEVRTLPGVADVVESPQVPVAVEPDDPLVASYGWNLRNTGANAYGQVARAGADVAAPTGWDATRGAGTVVAVVDTGFDSDHPDLAGALWTNPSEACGGVDTNGNGKVGDCHGWNFYRNSADVDNGADGTHGTNVAGAIAAALGNGQGSAGVAPEARIMPLVVGGGRSVDVMLAAQAIRYAADNGADVVNGSFGGSFTGPALTALSSAVDYAISKGVVVVVAAGNDSADRDLSPMYPANLANPALLTVGSTTASDTAAAHSAYGAATVDISAPGELVATTWNDGGYRLVSGTSIASPHVAAAAAMHLALDPTLTPAQVRDRLLAESTKLPALAGRTVSGGRLTVGTLRGGGTASYAFASMSGTAGAQSPSVTVTSTAARAAYTVTLGLAMLLDGEVWAVADEDVTLDGVTRTTSDAGTATFDLGTLDRLGTVTLRPGLTLGAGRFALTVQVHADGRPLSGRFSAPLVVAAAPAAPGGGSSGGGAPGGSAPGGSAPGGSAPGGSAPESPAPGGAPGGSDPGAPAAPTPAPGAPGGSGGSGGTGGGGSPGSGGSGGSGGPGGSGGTSPSDPATPQPTPAPSAPSAPGGGAGAPGPGGSGGSGGSGGGGTTPTAPAPAPAPAPGPAPSGPASPPPPGTTSPDGPDTRLYDRVGDFQVTSISPVHVGTAGGQVVTVRGAALEAGVSVRVGSTAVAHVVTSSTTSLVFVTPARVAGTYDVTLAKNGRTSVLAGALVYGAAATAPSAPPPGGATPAPGGTAPAPGGTSPAPGGTAPGGAGPAPTPSAPGPTAPEGTRTGPNGERLVRDPGLQVLLPVWSRACTTTCYGLQV